jgi:hypothetical protein
MIPNLQPAEVMIVAQMVIPAQQAGNAVCNFAIFFENFNPRI